MRADAKFDIEQALARYCHGVDRCDVDILKSAFWADATADYGSGESNAHVFAEGLIPALLSMQLTHHSISNILIQFDDNVTNAKVQTYCNAFHLTEVEGQMVEMEVGGRYLDQFEKRAGEWRIASRLYVMDWNRNGPSTANWTTGLYAQLSHRGGRGVTDPFYAFMK